MTYCVLHENHTVATCPACDYSALLRSKLDVQAERDDLRERLRLSSETGAAIAAAADRMRAHEKTQDEIIRKQHASLLAIRAATEGVSGLVEGREACELALRIARAALSECVERDK